MPRSAQEPDKVKIKRMHVEEDGLKMDLKIRWDIQQKTIEDMDGSERTEYVYEEEEYKMSYDGNKDMAKDFVNNNKGLIIAKGKGKKEAKTGKKIMSATERDNLIGSHKSKGKSF